jgi:tRNA A37 threonylcarbamoyladenosine synthetase subunit TsaC/SUA5/YrdC
MNKFDIAADARRVFDVVKEGGIGIAPADTGYGLLTSTPEAVDRVVRAKGRGTHKRSGMICDVTTQRELLRLTPRAQEIVETIVLGLDVPLGVLGPYDDDHPLIRDLDEELLRQSTAKGKLAMLINSGATADEFGRLSREENVPLYGSSANLTGTGARFRLEDVQPEIRAVADIEVDYGLRKYHHYKRSGTIIDFETMEVLRMGACYEQISDLCGRFFGLALPEDPGFDALPSGHLDEFGLVGAD